MKSRNENRLKRSLRSKVKGLGTSDVPRLVVFRSNTSLEVQVIDDTCGKTLVSYNSRKLKETSKNKNKNIKKNTNTMLNAKIVGKKIAELCIEKKIKKVIFDRNGYSYKGKIKCIADELRSAGLLN